MTASASVADPAQRFLEFMNLLSSDLATGHISFPTFVDATLKIRKALGDPDIDAGTLAHVIASEPLLSARLLQTANSVAFNASDRPVADVKSAVIRVGHAIVRALAMTVAMEQLQAAPELQPVRGIAESVWRHSIDVAALSFVIARNVPGQNPDEALFAGLVHDIGKFYLLSRAARYADLVADREELDRLLMDWHASIGSAVLTTLGVPEEVLSAVSEHELGGYAMPPRSLADIVVLANKAVHARDDGPNADRQPGFTDSFLVDLLQVHAEEIESLVRVLRG